MQSSYAIILCGGSGTRLWPLSRTMRPKQLLALNGEQTLLQQTFARVTQFVAPQQVYTVTHQDHKFEVKGQLSELNVEAAQHVLAEPIARNTLPAIAWAVQEIHQENPEAIIGVFASDHAIQNQAAFLKAWQSAEITAQQGYLTLLGIHPHEPATGYGYIKPAQRLEQNADGFAIFAVDKFVEKPDRATAQAYLAEGYLWNSGMFVFQAKAFMQMLNAYQPEIAQKIAHLETIKSDAAAFAQAYAELPNLSMDYGLAEKAEKVAVVPVDMAWSDLGSWDSIYQKQPKDAQNNAMHGEVFAQDTHNSLLWTESGVLATLGVSNIAVIQTPDATIVCDRSRAEDIKGLVAQVKGKYPELTEIHRTAYRPWGSYTVLEEGANFKIKRIVVNPGAQLSMQMHKHRSEHWVVVSGTATIANNEVEFDLHENQSTYISKTHRHRLSNNTDKPLAIIEVQCGDYVGEDDIVRFSDSYGRAPA